MSFRYVFTLLLATRPNSPSHSNFYFQLSLLDFQVDNLLRNTEKFACLSAIIIDFLFVLAIWNRLEQTRLSVVAVRTQVRSPAWVEVTFSGVMSLVVWVDFCIVFKIRSVCFELCVFVRKILNSDYAFSGSIKTVTWFFFSDFSKRWIVVNRCFWCWGIFAFWQKNLDLVGFELQYFTSHKQDGLCLLWTMNWENFQLSLSSETT